VHEAIVDLAMRGKEFKRYYLDPALDPVHRH
jgi:hypothetical protein